MRRGALARVRTLTTAGLTLSARSAKSGRPACAETRATPAEGDVAGAGNAETEGAAGAWAWLAEKWETATPEANANATMGSQRARKAGEWRGFSAEEREVVGFGMEHL